MFEIEQMEQKFDYSLVDNETAEFLRSCEYEMNGIAEDARVKFGGVLIKAQDKLAKKGYGVFKEWVVSGGISIDDAYYYINLNRTSRNLDERKQDNFLKAPKSLQKEVMKKNVPEELKEKVFDGDITTHKKYKELLQAKQQAEKKAEQAQKSEQIALRKLEEAEQKEPEVIEKEVVKEIVPLSFKEKLESAERKLNFINKENERLRKENDSYQMKDTEKFDEEAAKSELRKLHIEADRNTAEIRIVFKQLNDKVSVSRYMYEAISAGSDYEKKKMEEELSITKEIISSIEASLKNRRVVN